jgi:2-succinyl-5-enolpyruvyl-6-hydroxy-3-cyclohexene-1-carboxylate synthase
MYTDKQGTAALIETLVRKGLRHVVLSPGSRNAPLSLSFYHHPEISLRVIPDERSAGYFALGMAQRLKEPVAVVCTSGTAALNYAPAVAEAYYQRIPLMVLTADRPLAWVDQADGQTIRQRDVFQNFVRKSFEVDGDAKSPEEIWYVERLASEAFDSTQYPGHGPVHINVPLSEPLYGRKKELPKVKAIETLIPDFVLSEEQLVALSERWNKSSRKLILTGLLDPHPALNQLLHQIAEDPSVAVLTESTSNLHDAKFNPCIDRLITTITPEEAEHFHPELLITLGGPVISKKIKAFLRKYAPKEHWHIDPIDLHVDTFQCLTHSIPLSPVNFFLQLFPEMQHKQSAFANTWKEKDKKTEAAHHAYMENIQHSDLSVYGPILNAIPSGSLVHMGNSTPVRYVQLYTQRADLHFYSNRGTSGIDGSTSTAVGASHASGLPTTLLSGDISFFYDSNGLWNNYLRPDLRIIVLNNGGGGIFRIIEGPEHQDEIEKLFETRQSLSVEHLCHAFGLSYFRAENKLELEVQLKEFYASQNTKASVLEVFTPTRENPKVLKDYFEALKKA